MLKVRKAIRFLRLSHAELDPDALCARLSVGLEGEATLAAGTLAPRALPGGVLELTLPRAFFEAEEGVLAVALSGAETVRETLRLPLGRAVVEGRAERVADGLLQGWCAAQHAGTALLDRPGAVALLVDDAPVQAAVRRVLRADLLRASLTGGLDGFEITLPARVFDGAPHRVAVVAGGKKLPDGLGPYRFEVEGALRPVLRRGRVEGWCRDAGTADAPPLTLVLLADGVEVGRARADGLVDDGEAVTAAPMGPAGGAGFAFDVEAPAGAELRLAPAFAPEIDLCPPALLQPMARRVETLHALAAAAREFAPADRVDPILGELASLYETLRVRAPYAALRPRPARSALPIPARLEADGRPGVTIVVPVHSDLPATRRALATLINSGLPATTRILLIDDASPEPALSRHLATVAAADPRVTLVRHAANQGFVASANEGLRFAEGDDVVLLNADTALPRDWLARLRAAAYGRPNAASATPLSNDATIFSWPRPAGANPMPSPDALVAADALFRASHPGRTVEVPTGHGFCLYLRADALGEVGAFDPVWGRGYGEENDWCCRARARGFVHLAACDLFVAHQGGASFGPEKAALVARNHALLLRRYPEYDAVIGDFMRADPLAPVRRAVDELRLAQAGRPIALHVLHELGGGVQRFVFERSAEQMRAGATPLLLTPGPDGALEISGQAPYLFMRVAPSEREAAIGRLGEAGLASVHLHTLAGIDPEIPRTLVRQGIELSVTLHDYSWTCPRVTLLTDGGRFCGQPDSATCDACIERNGPHPAMVDYARHFSSVATYRSFAASLLSHADHVAAPSEDAGRRINALYPDLAIAVRPNLVDDTAAAGEALARFGRRAPSRRVVAPGALGDHKGYRLLHETAALAAARGSELGFVVAGHSRDDAALIRLGNVAVTGPYGLGEAPALLAGLDADLALLLSPWPETFSYALSECWAAGLPVACLDIGAPAERIRRSGGGWVLDRATDAAGPLAFLEGVLAPRSG